MSRLSTLCAAAALAVTAFVTTSPAQAGYHLIRWEDNGFCQIRDENIPTTVYPHNYTVASTTVQTLWEVLADKETMLRSGACVF